MTRARAATGSDGRQHVVSAIATLLVFMCVVVIPFGSFAQQAPIVYPARGQTIDQQSQDEGACRTWAQQQTGFNPSYGGPNMARSSGGGEILGGAARGALVGTIGGAIGGNAGKGAAVGAGVGATLGLLGKARNRRATQQYNQQAMANYNAQVQQFNRSFAACMGGRGYTVN